jgi:acyl-CoA synthetase (NDP forming)
MENKEMGKETAGASAMAELDTIFRPRSVAVIGVPLSRPDSVAMDGVDSLLEFQFSGPIYLINPRGGEFKGLKVYPSLDHIPGTVDYVISLLPARMASELVEQSARKGVKAVHFLTAGFSEINEEEGIRLEAELVQTAKKTGVRILGPNCLGIYCPESRISIMPQFPKDSGPVGLIMQSGGNTVDLVNMTMWRGVRFSKVVSYGNGCDLNESDFLEYLTDDPDTKIIGLYLEGVKDGKRFRQAWDRAVKEKVVILLKAGSTEAGAQAAASHTASLAGNDAVWDALCRQSGAIRVHSLPEMADMLVTATFLPRIRVKNLALIGAGGGSSVMLTDEFESRGMRVPPLPDDLRKRIREFTPAAGNIFRNPIDFSQAVFEPEKQIKAMKLISEWKDIDLIVGFHRTLYYRIMTGEAKRQLWHEMADSLLQGAKSVSKPMAIVVEPGAVPIEAAEVFSVCQEFVSCGLPVYYSFISVANALRLYMNSAF